MTPILRVINLYKLHALEYLFTYIATSKLETIMPHCKNIYIQQMGAFTGTKRNKVTYDPRLRICRRQLVSQQLLSCKTQASAVCHRCSWIYCASTC